MIVGNLGQTVIAFTDTFMVGRLGADKLAASGFSGGLLFVFLLFGFGILFPTAALFSRAHGRGETAEIAELLRVTVILAIGVSVFLLVGLWSGIPLLAHMGQTPEVVQLSRSFFAILVASAFPSMIYQAYRQFTDGLGHTRIGMYVMIFAVLLNVVGNYLLIYVFGYGLNGAAVATLISRIAMACILVYYVHKSPVFRPYQLSNWNRPMPWERLGKLLHLGVPTGLTYVFEVGAFTLSSVMMGWIGTASLAAHQVALNLASISFVVTVGIGSAASIRVGYELGQHRTRGAHFAARTALLLGSGFMCLSAVFVFFARHWLAAIYTNDVQVIMIAASFLAIAAAFQFFDGTQAVAVGILRGLQDTKWPSFLALIAYWVIGLPLGYFLAFKSGLNGEGIWWGLFAGLALIAIFLVLRIERQFKKSPLISSSNSEGT